MTILSDLGQKLINEDTNFDHNSITISRRYSSRILIA